MPRLGWKGWIPSFKDQKYSYGATLFKAVERPRVVEGWCPPVLDQGNLGSCGPHAAVTLMHSVMVQNNMPEWKMRSPLALYYFYRETTGEVDQDAGVYNRELLAVMAKMGVPAESLWPDDVAKWKVKPPATAYQDALNHQILSYHLVSGLGEMLNALATGYGFMGGMPVYQSFEDVGPSGLVPMPDRSEQFLGGHDLYFYGYDEHRNVIYGQNSWGTSWGKEGRFYLPFEYADKMLSDCWTITFQEG